MKREIIPYDKISSIFPLSGEQVVLSGGCFDLLHYGHMVFLNNSKKKGDIHVVALESDAFIISTKNREPVHTQQQRAEMLIMLRSVDFVILLPHLKTNEEYSQLVQSVSPHVITTTEGDPNLNNLYTQAESVGASVEIVVERIPQFSTSAILKKLITT